LFAKKRATEELYDLAADLKHQAMLEQIRKRLADWKERTGDLGREPEPMAMYDSDMKVYLAGGGKKAKNDELIRNIELNKKWASEGK
jgi:hypothetical protein